MKNKTPLLLKGLVCPVIFILVFVFSAKAQTETLSTGSFIINMGATNPNTIANGLKPYGLIYDLMRNHKVPVKWVISQTKVKDGEDFNYNGVSYKGGTFIVPAEFRSAAVNARITFWTGQGVVGTTTISPLTVNVTRTFTAVPKWTLDATNGAISEAYLINAGITNSAFAGAYNWKAVAALDCCDDFYVMPHADPTWTTHNRLFTWNKDCLGSIWAACHAVSALENSINPANATQQMNFLSTRTAVTNPTPWPNNSLKLWGGHSGGSVPYTHQLPTDQVAQYMGTTDLAQLNGSEQIYIPKQAADGGGATRWNPGATIIAYDPTQADVPAPNLAGGNVAALMVYGRGKDDPTRGYVMYEAGHSHNKGTAGDVAAQRAFLNFSFFQVQPKAPQLTFSGITGGQTIPGNTTITGLNVSATSPLTGITFTYQWSSNCGGTFSNATSASTNFTAPNVGSTTICILSCVVTDNCGRTSFQSFPVIILAATPPTVINDAQSIDPGCGLATVTKNVLTNDVEPDGQTMILTQINGNTGSFTTANGGLVSFTASGNITYTSSLGYVGTDVLTYTVCDNTSPVPLCSNGTYTLTIGNISNVPNAVNDAVTIAEDVILSNYNVLANDLPLVSGPITVSGIAVPPANGKVSVNSDNTITYVPNADFAGTDVITYRIVNSLGYSKTATLTVTVTNDACDGGTYQGGSGVLATVSGNDWSKVYTRPVNTGGANLTNTTSYTINSGTNRLLIIALAVGVNSNSTGPTPTVTWGGKTLTPSPTNLTSINRSVALLFFLKESDIATASSSDLIVSLGSTSVYGYVTYAAVYQNVDQTTSWRNGVSNANNASSITATASVNFTNGDQGIFVAAFGLNSATSTNYTSAATGWTGSSTLFGGNTTTSNPANGSYFGGIGTRNSTTTGTSETVSMTVSVSQRPSINVISLIPAAASCAAIPARAPLAMPDTATTNSSTVITFPVTTNDALFGQPITSVTISTAPSNGTATVIGNTIQYTPSGTFNGVATLQYTVTNANGNDVVKVYINVTGTPVNAVDDAPAGALSGTVQAINVKTNDTDPEGTATLSVGIVTAPQSGTATVDGSGNVLYTPNVGFTGNDTLYYSVCEPSPTCGNGFCDTARVAIVVLNRAPVANNDSKTILPCAPNTISLLTNDTDAEGNSLTVSSISAISPLAAGTLVNNNDGTVTFSPAMGFEGVVTFTYSVTDNGVTPQLSAPATVTITVQNPLNNPPVAVNDTETTNMDQKLYVNVRDNDSDPDNNPLTVPTITVAPLHGTAAVNPVNGLIEYTPNAGYFGTDVLTYQICDVPILIVATCSSGQDLCRTATLTITIAAPNTVLAINNENSTWINTPVNGEVMANDFDSEGDTKIFTGFMDSSIPVTAGSITISGVDAAGTPVANAGTLLINATGTYTFNPALDFVGVATAPYTIADNRDNPAVDTALLRITINSYTSISNSIIANNDENTSYGAAVSSNVLTNDKDPQGNTFNVTAFNYDTNGDGTPDASGTLGTTVTIGGVTTSGVPVSNAGSLTLNANGSYTYTPATDFHGSVDVPYSICDNGTPVACQTAILHIDVLPDINGAANDAPVAGDDFIYTNINTAVNGSFITNDNDPNTNPVSLNGTTIVTGGPQTPIGAAIATLKGGTIQYYADGTYLYTPHAGYVGPDSAVYAICDVTVIAPQPLCTQAFIHLLVGVNNTTDAINDENSTWQDVNVNGNVLTNDFDKETHTQNFGSFLLQNLGGDMATGAAVGGTDKAGTPVSNAGSLIFDASGDYTFNPEAAFTGTVSVPYRICDNGNLSKCDTAYLIITVDPLPTTGINTVIANNDENLSYGNPVSNSLFINDNDPQNNLFTVTGITGGTPGAGFTVPGINQSGNTVANAGTLIVNSNGSYTYTPGAFTGSINVPYTITDALGATATAILHITVMKDPNGLQNDPPFAGDDYAYTTINTAVSGSYINNDADFNADPVSIGGTTIIIAGPATPIGSPVATAQGGTVQFFANGTYTYTAPAGYIGPDKVNYTINDVTAINPQPLPADAIIHFLIGPGINISGKVWDDANGNVIDPGVTEPETNIGGTLYVNLVNAGGNVVAATAVAADGTYSFINVTPGANYSLQLTVNQGLAGNPAPVVALPTDWVNTGETRNGTIDGGLSGIIDTRNFGFTNTVNFDFGVNKLPESDDISQLIPTPSANFITTGTAVNAVSGTDFEDGILGNANTITITALPTNGSMYYNSVLVSVGQVIIGFDPALLSFTGITAGSNSIAFSYAFEDAAGMMDPTPATYTLNWFGTVPVKFIQFTVVKSNKIAILNFTIAEPAPNSVFTIERSTNGVNFAAVGTIYGTRATNYDFTDLLPLLTGKNYYRIKEVDSRGAIEISEVKTVQFSANIEVLVFPIPARNDLYITFDKETEGKTVFIKLFNQAGQELLSKLEKNTRATVKLDLTSLPAGAYHLVISSENTFITSRKIVKVR